MRLVALLIVLNSALGFCQEADFHIDKPVFKFAKTYEGTLLKHTFIGKNTGDIPLIISDYNVSCSCTKAIFSKDPIPPGASFKIEVQFDTKGKYYFQDRVVYFKTNSKKGKEQVRFKVNVIPKNE